MSSGSKPVALVTGGSSGIGKACVSELEKDGWIVYSISRHAGESASSGGQPLVGDVTKLDSLNQALNKLIEEQGRLDLVVNNAGFGISGSVEGTPEGLARQQFDTNFWGSCLLNQIALPYLKKTQGRIIHISSVAAAIPIPFQTYYSASKAALNAYVLALSNELKPEGVSVCVLMPGDVKTAFTKARVKVSPDIDRYERRIDRSLQRMEKDEEQGMLPVQIGKRVAQIASKRRIKPFYSAGLKYQSALLLVRLLPVTLSNWIIGKLYAR